MTEAEAPDPGPPARKRKLSLRRRGLKLLLDLMGRQESPERVAAAIALGVGIGLSPFIGFHFIMAIVLAYAFRLSRLDTVLGSLAGNPWTLPPFFAVGYRVGRALLGYGPARVPPLQWQRILHEDFWVAFRGPGFGPRLASFLVGTTLLAVIIALATYWLVLGGLRLYHRRYPRIAARAARRRRKSEAGASAAIDPPPAEPPSPPSPHDRVH
jgi:uncharacterized protein (DUF2062 family)